MEGGRLILEIIIDVGFSTVVVNRVSLEFEGMRCNNAKELVGGKWNQYSVWWV